MGVAPGVFPDTGRPPVRFLSLRANKPRPRSYFDPDDNEEERKCREFRDAASAGEPPWRSSSSPSARAGASPAGATARFRQTFQPDGPDRIKTRVLRETKDGWVATFPGSDRLVMTRRKS